MIILIGETPNDSPRRYEGIKNKLYELKINLKPDKISKDWLNVSFILLDIINHI